MPESNRSITIDFNCDMGEGVGSDGSIMPFISSANIACGYHAGNKVSIEKTVALAIQHQVAIGAHPSFKDKENFGRNEMDLPIQEIYSLVTDQIRIIDRVAKSQGALLHHVKPHGALYNMSAKNAVIAKTIAQATKDCDMNLVLYGLSGSYSISEARNRGLKTASEVFADRTYQDDGSLTPRSEANALIENPDEVVKQVLQMIKEGLMTTVSGKKIPIFAETFCIHGDGNYAVEFTKRIHDALKKEKINICCIGKKSGAGDE